MLDFRRVVKNRKIQPEAAFCPTKSLGLEWMDSNPRMQIAEKSNWRINEQRVIAFLAQGETPKTYGFAGSLVPAARNITIEPSHYADNLRNLYLHLPEAPAIPPGHINMSTLPLREVLPTYLHSCTRLIYSMHGDTA